MNAYELGEVERVQETVWAHTRARMTPATRSPTAPCPGGFRRSSSTGVSAAAIRPGRAFWRRLSLQGSWAPPSDCYWLGLGEGSPSAKAATVPAAAPAPRLATSATLAPWLNEPIVQPSLVFGGKPPAATAPRLPLDPWRGFPLPLAFSDFLGSGPGAGTAYEPAGTSTGASPAFAISTSPR